MGFSSGAVTAAFLSAVLIPSIGTPAFPLNPPLWSLFFEMLASVLLGLGLWNTRNVKLLAGASIVLGVLLVAGVIHRGSIDAGWAISSMHYGALRTAFGFTAGVLLYRVHIARPSKAHTPYWILATLLAAILVAPENVILQVVSAAVIFPAIIALASNSPSPETWATKWSGALSYPLYAVHYPIIILLEIFFPRPYGLILFAPTTLLASYMALRLYDEPIRKSLRAWVKR